MRSKIKALFNLAILVVLGAVLLWDESPAAAQTLKQTPFDDGTGSIGLPTGWQINNAYRGSVTCTGPNGAAVVLALPWMIVDPNSSVITLPSTAQHPIARPGDIGVALREVLQKRFGATLKSLHVAAATEFSPGVPAYYLLYEYERNGTAMTGLGYFTTLYYGQSSPGWQLYSSAVVAPREQFPQMVQTMLQMWRSWRPNGREPREGSSSALFDKILQDKQLSHERISKEFRKLL